MGSAGKAKAWKQSKEIQELASIKSLSFLDHDMINIINTFPSMVFSQVPATTHSLKNFYKFTHTNISLFTFGEILY